MRVRYTKKRFTRCLNRIEDLSRGLFDSQLHHFDVNRDARGKVDGGECSLDKSEKRAEIYGIMLRVATGELRDFIAARPYLVWSVKDYDLLSKEAIIEAVLNLGTWNDFQELVRIEGLETIAHIFYKQLHTGRQRGNYYPDVINYFTLYFKKYAPHAH